MMICPDGWRDYELIDAGEGMKLERWGSSIVSRWEPRAIWGKGNPSIWENKGNLEEQVISYKELKFKLKITNFGHTGVFPEQAVNWEWLRQQCSRFKIQDPIKILNLFAYTGGATMAAAVAGAQVTHVDSSKPAMMWAGENAQLTGVKDKIRWIQDDVVKFVKREIKRGTKYDGIIMDPPRFGRGASGEVWKFEDGISKLVWECKELLSPAPQLFLINAYTADLSNVALGNLLSDVMGQEVEFGELGLKETSKGRILPAGIFARWSS
ncbi:MAG: 23S rRNA (cytosine1962-C5)-methyltransferase [Microgenomates group bacterium Gr01-1014_16]|nr:MAG: 23S rRNA (cytosine1962-C5)-methyltransferase [Microgenomates group bacterium Gr01-1014_16]